jgi:hypothetical protein
MNRISRSKTVLISLGFLTVSVIGIALAYEVDSAGSDTGVSQSDYFRTEGDSNPWLVATVTRYMEGSAHSDYAGVCTVPLVIGPSSAMTSAPTNAPYVPVRGLVHTHSVQAKIPCPKEPDTETPTSTP